MKVYSFQLESSDLGKVTQEAMETCRKIEESDPGANIEMHIFYRENVTPQP